MHMHYSNTCKRSCLTERYITWVMGGFQSQFKQEGVTDLIYRGVRKRHEAKSHKLRRQPCSFIKHERLCTQGRKDSKINSKIGINIKR